MIDLFASEPHFIDHLAPVYRALGDEAAAFVVTRPMQQHAGAREIVPGEPDPSHVVVVASYGDVRKVRRHGYTRIVRLEHGIGQSYIGVSDRYGSYAGGRDHADVGLFLMPNAYSADRWKAAYPDAAVEIVGSPHLDALPERASGKQTVAIGFHWACYLVPETIGAWSHYRDAFAELASRFTLIAHGHPRALAARLGKIYRHANLEIVPDFHEVCRRADLYACDNSSSMYEFAATGRPVVVLNAPWYRRDVQHGLRFWEAADVGPQVESPNHLGDVIEATLPDPDRVRRQREKALDVVYAHRHGAARRAADAIVAWASGQMGKAA